MPRSTIKKILVPNIVVAAGHDPSGGAGIQADIEAIRASGGHAAICISCLTEQTTSNVFEIKPIPDAWFERCLERLQSDMIFQAIKVGVLASPGQVSAISAFKDSHPNCPLILDPVLIASGGGKLSDQETTLAMIRELIPRADLITPNMSEAQTLSQIIHHQSGSSTEWHPSIEDCVQQLQTGGARWVLLKGGDSNTHAPTTQDLLFAPDRTREYFEHDRLPHHYHGSGCTLASACATALAFNPESIPTAVQTAIEQTHTWLANAYRPGKGQHIPNRRPVSNDD